MRIIIKDTKNSRFLVTEEDNDHYVFVTLEEVVDYLYSVFTPKPEKAAKDKKAKAK